MTHPSPQQSNTIVYLHLWPSLQAPLKFVGKAGTQGKWLYPEINLKTIESIKKHKEKEFTIKNWSILLYSDHSRKFKKKLKQ